MDITGETMPLIFLLGLISFSSWAINWTDLVPGQQYNVNQHLPLTQLERSGSALEISFNEKVYLKKSVTLPGRRGQLYQFNYNHCPGPDLVTKMEIIPVQKTSPMVKIGAQLDGNCELNIYVKNEDLMSKSLFE